MVDRAAEPLEAVARFYGFGTGRVRGEATLFGPWPTPDLRPLGWQPVGHPPLHLLPAGSASPPPPIGLRIERVGEEATLDRWERTAVDAYPFRDLRRFGRGALLGGGVLVDDRLRLWLGSAGEADAAVAQAFVAHGVTNALMAATLRQARRKGYGAAMTWAAATTEPGRPAVLLSSDDGRPSTTGWALPPRPLDALVPLPLNLFRYTNPASDDNHTRLSRESGEGPTLEPE